MSSPGFLNASPSTSPGFSRVRIFFGSESKSESESGFRSTPVKSDCLNYNCGNLVTRIDESFEIERDLWTASEQNSTAEVEFNNAEKQREEAVNMSDNDIINLNVGGKKLTTRRSTLCQVKDSLLATMFSGRWEDNIERDKDGAVFFDFNPQHFILILNYLRVKKIETPENPPPLPKVPEDQSESFNSLVRYLGLSNEISALSKITPSEKFNSCSSGVTLEEGGQVAVHNQTQVHDYVLGENLYSQGTVNLKLKLESFQNNYWMFVGVTKASSNQSLASVSNRASFNWSGSYGWNLGFAGGWVWENGTCTIGRTLKNVSKQGDTVKLVLECEAGKLSLHLPTGRKFNIDIPKAKTWRLNVALLNPGDRIRILKN